MDESWEVLSRWCFEANPTHHALGKSVRTHGHDTLCQKGTTYRFFRLGVQRAEHPQGEQRRFVVQPVQQVC